MMLLLRKHYQNQLAYLLSRFPIVAIIGPRQCGKTTLAKETLSGFEYLDLELPSDFGKLSSDVEYFLQSRQRPIILDEAQRAPEIFPVIRSIVDSRRKALGQYIILGSASFELVKEINESLAGRVGYLELSPLLIEEVSAIKSIEAHWLKGGFPDALLSTCDSQLDNLWLENYTRSLIERDLPSLGIDLDSILFRKLWTMCSHFHGGILNKSKIGGSLGISPHTVERYLRILESTFQLRLLEPYHANVKKRLVKSPKLYFRDSGMFHYFSRIFSADDLTTHPNRGSSFEGYILEQLIQASRLRSDGTEAFFFQTSDNYEVDLLLIKGKSVTAFEIKSKLSPTKDDIPGLLKALDLMQITNAVVIGTGDDIYPLTSKVKCFGIHAIASKMSTTFWK